MSEGYFSYIVGSLRDTQREFAYTTHSHTALPDVVSATIRSIERWNRYEHSIRYRHTRYEPNVMHLNKVEVPYNWENAVNITDLQGDLKACLGELHNAHMAGERRVEMHKRLVERQVELAVAKDRLDVITELEEEETVLTIRLIALNSEILDTIIKTEQVRLAGMERRAQLMLEAAEYDAKRWNEWMLQSGNRFDDLEAKRAETARILAETRDKQTEYLAGDAASHRRRPGKPSRGIQQSGGAGG